MADFTELVAWCADNNTTRLIVQIDDEDIVDETWTRPDEPRDVASVQKLVTGVLLGRLVTSGDVDLDDPVNTMLEPGWSDAGADHESAITVSHLATMTAGLDDHFRRIGPLGTGWYYCNAGYHLLRRALERRFGGETEDIFHRLVFEPCGMEHSSFRPRSPDNPDSFAGLFTTGRDLARFGRVLLNDEPFGIARDVVTRLRTATAPNPSYGHLVWIYGGRTAVIPGVPPGEQPAPGLGFGGIALDRPIADGIPHDAFGGSGAGDQRLTVIPSKRAVIVRVGQASGLPPGAFDEAFWSRVPTELRETRPRA